MGKLISYTDFEYIKDSEDMFWAERDEIRMEVSHWKIAVHGCAECPNNKFYSSKWICNLTGNELNDSNKYFIPDLCPIMKRIK
jgi:hypothetical protein